jgi:uncharacterized protein YdcH (DUF465 family)
MKDYERAQIEALSDSDPELRGLWQEHLDFEQKLADFGRQSHLTPGEMLERKQIQKLKLAGKDRIAQILARHAG